MNPRALPVSLLLLLLGAGVDLLTGAGRFPGFYALLGFGSTVLLIVVAKILMSRLVQRPEDHYPLDVPPDRVEDLRG